jgi:hypothetical protein
MSVLTQTGFNDNTKNLENICNTHTLWYGCHIIIPVSWRLKLISDELFNVKFKHAHHRFPYRSFPHLCTQPHFISCHKCMTNFRLRPARYWSIICRHANRIHSETLQMSSQSHTVRSLYNSSFGTSCNVQNLLNISDTEYEHASNMLKFKDLGTNWSSKWLLNLLSHRN